MKRAALTALLALSLFCVAIAAAGRGALEIVLFDAPRGAWLGALRDDAPLVVLEERDGWRRVRLEGWTMAPGSTAPPGPGSAASDDAGGGPAPAAASPVALRPAVVQGVLAALPGAGGAAGSGVLVLLVKESGSLDSEHRQVGSECRAGLEQRDRVLGSLRVEVDRALNSSDNFREASGRNDQGKVRLAAAQRERRDFIQECRARAQAVFEVAVAGRAISDASGRFEFQGVAPGRYRVVAFESAGEAPRTWSFSFRLEGDGARVLDPVADRSPVPADWGLR